MAANRTFDAGETVGQPDNSLEVPIKEAQLSARAPRDGNKEIKWHYLAEFTRYAPYLVKVTDLDLDKNLLSFQFIDCEKATPMKTTHTIDLRNWPLVYAAPPSTIPTKAEFDADQTIAFLMLNPDKFESAMLKDAKASNAGEMKGKWPGGSEEEREFVRKLQAEIRELLKVVPKGVLAADKLERLELLSAEG